MAPLGAARTWFTEGQTTTRASYVSPEEMAIHDEIFAADKGGYGPPLMWYKAQMANVNVEDEVSLAPERSHIQQPTLLICADKDVIAIAAMQEQGMRPFVKDLKIEHVDSGHWVQLEKPEKVNRILATFLEEVLEAETIRVQSKRGSSH